VADGTNSPPRSHIYIAGSNSHRDYFNKTRQPAWKVGHAYCLVDRFFTAPDSYYRNADKAGYWPRCVWHWVDNGRHIETSLLRLLRLLRDKVVSQPKFAEDLVGKTEPFNLKYDELYKFIADYLTQSKVAFSVCEFSWEKDKDSFDDLRDCLIASETIDDVEKFRRAMLMVVKLKPHGK